MRNQTGQAGTLSREFAHYLFPSVASMVSLSCYILADTYFVATGVGGIGLAGLNIALPAYSLVNALGLMLGIGAGVVVAVSRGRGDAEQANEAFGAALAAALLLGLVLTAAGVTLAAPIARLLGASAQSLPYAATYLRTITSFSVFFLLNNVLVALVRNDGNPRLAMTSMVACSLSNVVLDYIFIMVFGWGMWGAAFATGLAPMIGIAILSLHWLRGAGSLRLERRLPRPARIPAILRGGSSNFIIELGNGVVILLFNQTLMALSGDLGVAAYGIVANIALVVGNLFVGVGQGMQPIASRLHGEGDACANRRLLRMGLAVVAVASALFCGVGLAVPDRLAALFNSENNAALAALTVRAIRIYFTAFLFMGANICCASWFQAVLRPKTASALSLLRAFLLVAAGMAVLPRLLGLDGVWLIVPAAELLTALASIALLLRRERAGRVRGKNARPERNPA